MASPSASLSASLPFPRPQRLRQLGESWALPSVLTLSGDGAQSPSPALEALAEALRAGGHRLEHGSSTPDTAAAAASQPARAHAPAPPATLRLMYAPLELERRVTSSATGVRLPNHAASQGYVLELTPGLISIWHHGDEGLHNALSTLIQLVTSAAGAPGALELPALAIEDWPDFAQRGVMLDISRDKVPTLSTLRALVDRLASWKVNQLQLYMEHTFAYTGHERVWGRASPLTAEEVRELDAYCAARHVELVPNQNSFGHMHRWLVHEPYRALAECPEGFDHPWNWGGEPYGLCATDPGSLAFLEGLYDELLPSFRSRLFNVGLDETLDLGAGRSRAACEARGTERVYLEFLKAVQARVESRGHVMQFWGDIIIKRPDLIPELPKRAIALEWGYEADHPFAAHLELFQRAGLDFYVCPGTSSWNSIAGRTENAILNLARAARAGQAAGARGYLVTDWGDHGHLQPLSVSYLGLLAGAGFAWNVSDAAEPIQLDLPALLDQHAFFDAAGALGRVAHDLGNAYREAGSSRANASALFWSLIKPERLLSPPGVTEQTLEHTLSYVDSSSAALGRAEPGRLTPALAGPGALAEGARVLRELGWVRDVLRFSCRLGLARIRAGGSEDLSRLSGATRAELTRDLGPLIEQHRASWLERNRPGGLDDSARRLERTLEALGGR